MSSQNPNKSQSSRLPLITIWAAALTLWPTPGFSQELSFSDNIWPIIVNRCIECHGPEKQKEDLRFDDLEWLSDQELLGDGDASESLIYELIALPRDDEEFMPKKRQPVSPQELEQLRQWLDDGAKVDGWEIPKSIVVKRSGGELDERDLLAELADGLGPAPEAAVRALQERGALVLAVSQNNPLVRVDFGRSRESISNADLALLEPLSQHVTWLGLANTEISDGGVETVGTLQNLTRLDLGNTPIGDRAMAHVAKLSNLQYLNLVNTAVGDDGLRELSGLKNLRKLFLWRSKVTAGGAKSIEASIPGLTVNLGILAEPTTE